MLYRDSERVGPTGNVTSRGVMNQLGRPQLEPLAVLIREAVQNSWDARAVLDGSITFGIAGWTFDAAQMNTLQTDVFADLPSADYLPLYKHLHNNQPMRVIAIYDKGTTGLGGPTRADLPSPKNEARDFVDFLRNVGQPPDKQLAGGTYGYGKAAFYRVSHTQTICVFTRCVHNGKQENRFIAAALGEPYTDANNVLFTGRHWWGQNIDKVAEPLTENAEIIADKLGMSKLLGSDLGTVILILQPQLDLRDDLQDVVLRTPLQGMHFIAENILLYFWPKMLKYNKPLPSIRFEITWEGQPIELPNPEDFPPLQGFVQAMYRLKGYPVKDEFPYKKTGINSERPMKYLGELSLQKYPISSYTFFDTGEKQSVFMQLDHHTALMRQPELIVKYLSGARSINQDLGIFGVFITDREVDPIFAESEPPTHDDWVPAALVERWHRVYVNVAHTRINEQMELFAKPPAPRVSSRQMTPLGAFSNSLGSSLLISIPGNAAKTPFSKQYAPPRSGSLVKPVKSTDGNEKSVAPITNPSEKPSDFGAFRSLIRGLGFGTSETPPQPPPPIPQPLMPAPSYQEHLEIQTTAASSSQNGPSLGDPSASDHNASKLVSEKPVKKTLGTSTVTTLSNGEFVLVDGTTAFKIEFEVEHGKNAIGTDVSVDVKAVIDGGAVESEPPIGGNSSKVIRWIDNNQTIYAGSPKLFINVQSTGTWAVVISLHDDTMIDVDFTAEARG